MLNFRPFRSEDEAACVALLQAGHDAAFTAERFRWLHLQNPLAPSAMVVAYDGDDVVGLYSAIRKQVVLDGRSYVFGRDVDPVVHPSQRGRGVFTRLLRYALEEIQNIDIYFNFANPASAPGFVKCGWRAIGTLDDAVCQTGAGSMLSAEYVYYLLTGARVRCGAAAGGAAGVEERTAADIAALLPGDATPPVGRCWVARSPAYLAWRYFENPRLQYRYFCRLEGVRLAALLVTRELVESRTVLVMDLLSYLAEPAEIEPFLPVLAREFPQHRLKTWSTMPAPGRQGFQSNFLKRGKGQPFFVRAAPGRELPAVLHRLAGWMVTHGDSEFL